MRAAAGAAGGIGSAGAGGGGGAGAGVGGAVAVASDEPSWPRNHTPPTPAHRPTSTTTNPTATRVVPPLRPWDFGTNVPSGSGRGVAEVGGGRIRPYAGDYAYFLWRKAQEEQNAEAADRSEPVRQAEPGDSRGSFRELREQSKAQQRELRRLEREEQELLTAMEQLEEEGSRLEHLLAREDVYRDGQRVREIKEHLEAINARR